MSYARFGWDGSDVYVFGNTDNMYECCGCLLQEREWVEAPGRALGGYFRSVGEIVPHVFDTPGEMVDHLMAHRAAGHTVPDDCIAELRAVAAG